MKTSAAAGWVPDMAEQSANKPTNGERDYSMFEADLSGAVLNMHLLGRLLK